MASSYQKWLLVILWNNAGIAKNASYTSTFVYVDFISISISTAV